MSPFKTSSNHPNRATELVDNILLLVLVVAAAVRCQISESLAAGWRVTGPVSPADISGAAVTSMLLFAGIIITAGAVWLAVHIKDGQLDWRKSALLVPLVLLTAAGGFSGTAASNKSAALVGAVNLLSQVALAILLVQLLDRPGKRRLLLAAIAATGLVMAQRCWDQYLEEIPHTIAMYNANPNEILAGQGLEPGTYQADQYARRLMSRDVGGYLLISNTAAAFFILSLGATLALISAGGGKGRLKGWNVLLFIGSLAAVAAQISALVLTQSKGGIGAAMTAAVMVLLLWLVKGWARRHWRAILAAGGILIIAAVAAAVAYGITHGRLPGNSMWVRWQYWQATAAMIGGHWLRGVGPDNFGQYYTHYMSAAAPEVIRDPHCLPLAMWSQWGLLGLVGLIWAVVAATVKLARPVTPPSTGQNPAQWNQNRQPKLWRYGIIAASAILLIKLAVAELGEVALDVRLSVYLIAIMIPTGLWLAGFMVMAGLGRQDSGLPAVKDSDGNMTVLILGGGLLGCLLQNSIDFSLFQPGVGTCFFTLAAAALAAKKGPSLTPDRTIKIKHGKIAALAVLTAAGLLWLVIIIPVTTAQQLMELGQRQALAGNNAAAAQLARQAEGLDRRDPEIPNFLARLNLVQGQLTDYKLIGHLADAIANGEKAIQRDPANYKFYRQLSEIYLLAAQNQPHGNHNHREKALSYMRQAVARYPTSPALLIQFGRLLQEQGQWQAAKQQYEKALQNEEAFLRQQQQMYPARKQLSPRLDPQLRGWVQEEINKILPHEK